MTRHLFSIDVEAHLRKAASHTFSSPSHYPVELVRWALRRGAERVDVDISGDCIEVRDNGKGLAIKEIETLVCLLDKQRSVDEKESAVEWLQTREGMGLLAIFAPRPGYIRVENESHWGKRTIEFKNNKVVEKRDAWLAIKQGTIVNLLSRHRDVEQEKNILSAFCRKVTKSVYLNGRILGNEPLLINQLATVGIVDQVGGQRLQGMVGIPVDRLLCHIRLLDQFIPWHHVSLPPQQGFIFDVALEYVGEINGGLIELLCHEGRRLYEWLVRRYDTASPVIQGRIEELVFSHARLTGNCSLVDEFKPFRLYHSDERWGLKQVKERVANGMVYAVPVRKEPLDFNSGGKSVLFLQREQADFLINTLRLPISFLNPVRRRRNRGLEWGWMWRQWFRRWVLKLWPKPGAVVLPGQMTEVEKRFMEQLNQYLKEQVEVAVLVSSKWPFPWLRLKVEGDWGEKREVIGIRRQHPLIHRAVRLVAEDKRNIVLLGDLFQP